MAAKNRRMARTMMAIWGESRPAISRLLQGQQPRPWGQTQIADLQGRHVIRQLNGDGRLHVQHIVVPEEVPKLLLVLIDHLDDPVQEPRSRLYLSHPPPPRAALPPHPGSVFCSHHEPQMLTCCSKALQEDSHLAGRAWCLRETPGLCPGSSWTPKRRDSGIDKENGSSKAHRCECLVTRKWCH